MRDKRRLYSIVVGGLAFWLPTIAVFAIWLDPNILWLNAAALMGLIVVGVADSGYFKGRLKWGWVLAGIYIFGPLSILTAGALSGGTPPWRLGMRGVLLELAICLFPPATLFLSFYNATFLAVLAASFALPLYQLGKDDLANAR